jgi:predicted O-linked N-acetylglucosamine transferase (SPINDLY family)
VNLRAQAQLAGVNPDRLIFAERLPMPEYLAQYTLADLFLDTFPYNAHSTCNDALWAGLPVISCMGETFAGRVAASQLNAIGLPELVTSTPQDYEALALTLASNPKQLADIKQKLKNNRLDYPLFNTSLFTRNLELAYVQIVKRYQSGQQPDHIHLSS